MTKKKDVIRGIMGLTLILDILTIFIIIGRTIWLGWTVYGIKLFLLTLLYIPFVVFIKYVFSPEKTKTKTPN